MVGDPYSAFGCLIAKSEIFSQLPATVAWLAIGYGLEVSLIIRKPKSVI